MTDRFRALVLGGSGALGRGVCQNLAAQGARVAFTYHSGESVAKRLERELPEAQAWKADLTSVPAVERTVDAVAESLGGIDALIHCAGVCIAPGENVPSDSNQRMEDIQEPGWDLLMAVNAKSAFFACRRVARYMHQAGGGNIVLIGSINVAKPEPSPVHYAASKGALLGMTLAMAKELGKSDIRVNLVTPGLLEAGIAQYLPEHLRQEYIKHCGLRRLGRIDEIAQLVVWLACHNTYVTGQQIVVDGAL